jgi:general secretion pathway protein F/type IV pilus assembly protein PilC
MFTGMALPVPTVVLFALSDVVRDYWAVVLGVVVTLVLAFWGTLRSAPGRRWLDEWRMKMPVVGRVLRLVSITRFCRILGTMLANGVPILQSLAIAKDATGSALLAEAIDKAAETVRAGERLATPLKACGLFPLEVVEMISVAEESNQLEKILVEIADTVERRTNRQVDLAVRLIEPLILVMMALGIAFVAVGLYYPILTMASTLK